MQTRRDQLHAYKFQNRRALAALVTGDPNVVEAPMRRLTITTVSGIMIAVLVTVGFTLFGLIRPKAGDSWKEAGSIIVEEGTGATYVYLGGTLHTVANYTSAVLAVGNNAHTVNVERGDIDDAKRGPQVGIPGLPGTLPDAGGLVTAPVTACSREQPATDGSLDVRVSVLLGSDAGATAISARKGIVVRSKDDNTSYLLYQGHRLAIGNTAVATALGLASVPTLQVGRAFLDAVPVGTNLSPPKPPSMGKPANIPGIDAVVGQLLKVRGSDSQYFVALADGTAPVNPVERALLQTLPLGAGAKSVDALDVSLSDVINRPSKQWDGIRAATLAGLPSELPDGDSPVATGGGICAVFAAGSDTPRFAMPKSLLPSYSSPEVGESDVSQQGLADTVDVPPGGAALVRSSDGARTTFLVGDTGKKFAAPTDDVLGALGYQASDATVLPAQLLALIPVGPAMVPAAARRTISQ